MKRPCAVATCQNMVEGQKLTCSPACRKAKERGAPLREAVPEATQDEETILGALIYAPVTGGAVRGRGLRLKQAKEVIDDALGTSIDQGSLREIFRKFGVKEYTPDRKGIYYDSAELEDKIWSRLTGTRPILYTDFEFSGECTHETSLMYGGTCRCAFYGNGGSSFSPGSSMSIAEQRLALGLVDDPEALQLEGTGTVESGMQSIMTKEERIAQRLERQREFDEARLVQDNYDKLYDESNKERHEKAMKIRRKIAESKDTVDGSAVEVLEESK